MENRFKNISICISFDLPATNWITSGNPCLFAVVVVVVEFKTALFFQFHKMNGSIENNNNHNIITVYNRCCYIVIIVWLNFIQLVLFGFTFCIKFIAIEFLFFSDYFNVIMNNSMYVQFNVFSSCTIAIVKRKSVPMNLTEWN